MNIIGVLIVLSNQYIINGVSPNSLLEIERTIVEDQDNHYCNQSETAIMQIPIIKWPKDSKNMGFCATESAIFLRLGTFHGLQRLSVSFVHAGLQLRKRERKRDKDNISISDARTGRVN